MYNREIMNSDKPESKNQQTQRMKEIYRKRLLLKIEDLNRKAYDYYKKRKTELSDYYLIKELWKSDIWHQAKITHVKLNSFVNGTLTCQFCNQEIQDKRLRNFQLHHRNKKYDFKRLFSLNEVEIIHKNCHKKLHNNFNNNKRGKK